MAVNTETIPVESGTAVAEATHPPSGARRVGGVWAAIVAACIVVAALAFATFSGGDDSVEVPAVPFNPQVEQWEREAHLQGNARTYSSAAATSSDPAGTDSSAGDANDDEFLPDSRHVPTR